MIYFDYSATTPTSKECLDSFIKASNMIGNANSPHKLGKRAKEAIDASSTLILNSLRLSDFECIYTSGSTEANNLAIKGIFEKQNISLILTTPFEHSSIIAPCASLQRKGVKVEYLDINRKGEIDLVYLQDILNSTQENILITIASVNSEIGSLQNIREIINITSQYDNVFLHIDATQSIGKVNIDFNGADLISLSAHKIYGIKGIGALLKSKKVKIGGQILGGSSTTRYRSGTPCHPLIVSFASAVLNSVMFLKERYEHVEKINKYIVNKLRKFDYIRINSSESSVPHILNISILGIKSIDTVLKLSEKEIYISNHSACSSEKERSEVLYYLTNDEEISKTSVRISISHLSTFEEADLLINAIKELKK